MGASLIFDLLGRDVSASAALKKVAAEAEHSSSGIAAGFKKAATGVSIAGLAAVGESVRMAGNFQYQMNRMVVAAGELPANLSSVSNGVLKVMADTGTSAEHATAGLYMIESAGFHGADGLKVLAVAAQGAKIENADLHDVANAVSSAMVDYKVKASDSASVMNTLIAGVAHGKTTLGEMALAFVNVGAAGAAAHIPMADLTAAIATMTMHGTDASKAGTYLRQVIGQLEAPSAKARKVMEGLGLDANQVGLTLSSGPGGLAKAIGMLDDAITSHLTPSGLVAIDTFKKSAGSATDYQKMLANLPPAMVTTFGALSQMTGGVRSLQGFLQLGGNNLGTFKANTLAVNEAVAKGGKKVEGWAATQKTLNVQLSKMSEAVKVAMIELGTKLIPTVTKVVEWIVKHKDALIKLVVALVAMAVAVKVINALVAVARAVMIVWNAAVWLGTAAISAFRTAQILAMYVMDGTALSIARSTVALAAQKVALVATTVASKVAAAGMWLFNAAISANPITLIIIAIVALIGVFVLAYNKIGWFRDFVKAAFRDIAGAIGAVINWVKQHWPLLLAIFLGPFGLMIDAVVKHWATIRRGITDVINWIRAHWAPVYTILSAPIRAIVAVWVTTWNVVRTVTTAVVNWIRGHWAVIYGILAAPIRAVVGVFVGVWSTTRSVIAQFIRWVADVGRAMWGPIGDGLQWLYDHVIKPVLSTISGAISGVAKAVGAVSHAAGNVGHAAGNVAHFFGFAGGTDDAPPGMAWVGERGKELIQMPAHARVFTHTESMAMTARRGSVGVGGRSELHVHVHAPAIWTGTNPQLAKAVVGLIEDHVNNGGTAKIGKGVVN